MFRGHPRRPKHAKPSDDDPTQRPDLLPNLPPPPPPNLPAPPVDLPPPPNLPPPPPLHEVTAYRERASVGPDLSPVARMSGLLEIPQITVGAPSPTGEPAVIAAAFRSFPFRPDSVIDGWSTETMILRGASLRGHLHRYSGAPRQDDFAIHHLVDGRVIVLVADGVSGAMQSHIGASTAIRIAAQWLQSNLQEDIQSTDWMTMFKGTAWKLTEQAKTLFGLDELDPVQAEAELATTLVCAVVEPIGPGRLRAHLVRVGDSGAWLLSAGRFVDVLSAKTSESGVSSSAVVGLPRVPNELTPVVVEFQSGDVLLIGTDGIGDPLGSGEGGVGNLFRDILTGPGTPPSLIEFANVVDFSRETFDDDRTLVAVWPKQVAASGTPGELQQPGMPFGSGHLR